MSVLEILGFATLGAGLWLWFDSLSAREAGMHATRAACRAEGLLLLDDTVSIRRVWPARDEGGRLRLRRTYQFEYSDTGNNRRQGAVTLLGREVITLHLGPRAV